MKKFVFLVVLIFFAAGVSAISSNLKDSYMQKETIIGELSGSILSQISKEQVSLLKDGHISVAFDYDIKRLGNNYFIWLTAPQNAGNYTLKVNEIVALVSGVPEVVDYEKNFIVTGNLTDYSIKPGFISTKNDFSITATLYEDFNKEISVDFPEQRTILLVPGVNEVDFSITDVVGIELIKINVGKYSVPAHITGNESICGDGEITGGEVCDGENLDGKNCSYFGYEKGELSCDSDCFDFDTYDCEMQSSECGKNHLGLCDEGDCEDFGGFWYNDECNIYEEGTECGDGSVTGNEICDGKNLAGEDCESQGYSGGKLMCTDNCLGFDFGECEDTGVEKNFTISPALISGKALISESTKYSFSVINQGKRIINDLRLDYDGNKFLVEPDENFSLAGNESKRFTISLKNPTGSYVKGAIVVYSENVYKSLIVNLGLTENANEIVTQYVQSSSGGEYYCSELSGVFCSAGESCSSETVETLDGAECCTGNCETPLSGKAWIGYLIVGIVILAALIIFVKYRKTNVGGNPLKARVSGIEKNMP